MRYFVQFSYQGQRYHGWQNQPNALTVQSVLEDGFSKLLRAPIALVGAGRTDAGVHARQMYAHFDADAIENCADLIFRLNAFLPEDIAVQALFEVADDAHARFHATERKYEYWIVQEKNPFWSTGAHHIKHPLDIEKMNEAAAILLEYEDFECFSKSNTDVRTYRCDIKSTLWERRDERLIFSITADRFLRNMVRAIVGTLLDVGSGRMEPDQLRQIIAGKDRSRAGASVPAKGLYLTRVLYPEDILN